MCCGESSEKVLRIISRGHAVNSVLDCNVKKYLQTPNYRIVMFRQSL